MNRGNRYSLLTLCSALAGAASCAVTPTEPARPPALERVVAIGASMTAGMQLDTDLGQILEEMIRVEHDPVLLNAEMFFFANPGKFGESQTRLAREADPTLLVALDYLFWFGYGITADRMALLESGLELLAGFDCPIVVGDFPNMEDAVGKMLTRRQMPSPDELEALNARLAEWVAANPHVIQIPLSDVVTAMRAGAPFRIGRYDWPADSSDRVIQGDQLHPTFEGLAAMAHLIGVRMVERGVVGEDDVELDLGLVLGAFGEVLAE